MSDAQDIGELRAATVHGLRWTVIARPLVECILLASMVVLARLIPPADFGHYATALVISGFGAASVSALTTALVQRADLEHRHLQAAQALALTFGAVLVVLSLIAASVVVEPIFGAATAGLVRLGAPGAFVAAAGAVPFAVLQRRLQFRRLAILDVVGSGLRGLGSVALALAGLNGSALVLGAILGTAAQTGIAWAWAPPPLPRPSWHASKDLLHYGTPNWLAAVSWIGFANCDYAIVGARLGAVSAGLYFRAYTLAVEYQKKVSGVMASVGFPVLARTRNSDDMGELRGQMVGIVTVTLFPCLALLAIVAPVAVPFVFGAEWQAAVAPTQVLAIGGASVIVIDAAGATLMAAARPRAVLAFGWAHFVTYAIAVWFTAPYGLTAVAGAAAVVHTAFVFVAYSLMFRRADASVAARIWHDVAPALCSCAGLVALALPVSAAMTSADTPAPVYLAVVTLLGVAGYLAVLRTRFVPTWRLMAGFVLHLIPQRARRRQAVATPVEVLAESEAVGV